MYDEIDMRWGTGPIWQKAKELHCFEKIRWRSIYLYLVSPIGAEGRGNNTKYKCFLSTSSNMHLPLNYYCSDLFFVKGAIISLEKICEFCVNANKRNRPEGYQSTAIGWSNFIYWKSLQKTNAQQRSTE